MERLTKDNYRDDLFETRTVKVDKYYSQYNYDNDLYNKVKDTEEKFGIDFITFYEAITNGVWVKDDVGQIYHTNVYLHNLTLTPSSSENGFCFITPDNKILLFNRIKKDWGLTKEELE